METILNLVWTLVSAGLLITCGIHVLRGGEDRRRAIAAVALLCLVCLLFPVISATDDINAASPALLEINKFKRFVTSAPAALTVLSGLTLQVTIESRWSVDGPSKILRPLSDAFAFKLSRRPPPASSHSLSS